MATVKDLEKILPPGMKIGILISYFSCKKIVYPSICNSLFLDSGAFSAFKKNIQIDLSKYISFIKKQKKHIDVYASLDVIGNAKASLKNHLIMQKAKLNPIPCFHYSEPFKYLEEYVRKHNYIALGGVAQIGSGQEKLFNWLQICWGIISKINPEIKVHGFGIQGERIMKRFPWYSIDSTSAHLMARYGGIYTPFGGAYKINPRVAEKDLKWMSPLSLKKVREWVETLPLKIKVAQIFKIAQQGNTEGATVRMAINILYFEKLIRVKSNSNQSRFFGFQL